MLKNLHHVNLLVSDLEQAMGRYRDTLGVAEFVCDELVTRGVRTARFMVGQTWIVLVQPMDPLGIPGRHLAEHGEGLFLLSFEVDTLDSAVEEVRQGGGHTTSQEPRRGLEDWRVIDLDAEQFHGAQLQLMEHSPTR